MKKIILLLSFFLIISSFAQSNYKDWSKNRTSNYDKWSKTQNWQHNYFKWNKENKENNDQWEEESGWNDNFAMDNEAIENVSSFVNGDNTQTPETTQTQTTPQQMVQVDAQVDTTPVLTNQVQVQNNAAQAQIIALQEQVSQLQTQVNTTQTSINQTEQNNTSQAQITTLQAQISQLQTENSNLLQQQSTNSATLPNLKIWAVIVGVAKYREPKSRLNYCDDDAYKIYGFLKSPEGGALPDEQITLLIDEDANGNNIKNAIRNFTQKAGKNDAFLLYYSGHGSPNNLLGEDYSVNSSGTVSHSFINQNIANSKAKYTYCIIDACHSGNISMKSSKSTGAKSIAQLENSEPFYTALNQSKKGSVFILSSKGTETSLETGNKRQGIFSYYFINGLKGNADYNNDGIISVTEVFDYTQKNVVKYSKNRQNPIMTGEYSHTMPISIVRK